MGLTQAAEYLGISWTELGNRAAKGEIPFSLDLDGRRRFSKEAVTPFIAADPQPPQTRERTNREVTGPAETRPLTFRAARNLMGASAVDAVARGLATPEQIRDEGLAVLRNLASDTRVDDRVRERAAQALASLGSAEVRQRKFSQAAEDLQDLSDDELVDLQAIVGELKLKPRKATP